MRTKHGGSVKMRHLFLPQHYVGGDGEPDEIQNHHNHQYCLNSNCGHVKNIQESNGRVPDG